MLKQGKYLAWLFVYDPLLVRIYRWFKRPRHPQTRRTVFVSLITLGLVLLAIPHTVAANWFSNALGDVVMFFYTVAAEILSLAGIAFNKVVEGDLFNQIISSPAVGIGWTATRDICNLVFVLILLGIGFATILRVPTYHIKKLIIPFIVALLLINFSKLICGVVTDFCHVIMASFNAAMQGGESGNYSGAIANAVGVGTWLRPGADFKGELNDVANLAIVTMFMFALAFAFLLLAALLVSRWITLLVLTIFSPLIYAAQILPTTKGFAKKWWQQFLQNAFYGPVAVFMVYLAISIVMGMSKQLADSQAAAGAVDRNNLTWATLVALLIACILLYKAVTFSKNLGIAGAGAIISTGTKWGKSLGSPLTDRVRAAWGARKSAIQSARKESGERWGTGRLARATMLDSGARAKSRAAQESLRASREKQASEAMRPGDKGDEELQALLKGGSKQQKLAAGNELAKRGKLDRASYDSLKNMGGISAVGLAGLKDTMSSTDPMAEIDRNKLRNGDVAEKEKLDSLMKRADLKKLSTEALTNTSGNNDGNVELLNSIARVRGKDSLTDIHKNMTSEADKRAFGDTLKGISAKGLAAGGNRSEFMNIAGASLAINKELALDSSGNLKLSGSELAELAQKADSKDLSIALTRPGAMPALNNSQNYAMSKVLSPGKLKNMQDHMGSGFDDFMRIQRAASSGAFSNGNITPSDAARLSSINSDPILRSYGL